MAHRLCIRVSLAALAALLCLHCAPRPRPEQVPFPRSRPAADRLFQQAESKYQTSAFAEALGLFRDYLARYPDEPQAPAALMRMGAIYTLKGRHDQARSAYARLISDYPSSPLKAEAAVERLNALLREGDYPAVVAQGPEALRDAAPALQARVFTLMGDAHAARGDRLPAVAAYTQALRLAAPGEQAALVPKLRSAILVLSPDQVQRLARLEDDRLPMDYLLFQSGMLFAREGRVQEAALLLKAFRARYPGHEQTARAEQALAEIEKGLPAERRVLGGLLPLSGSHQGVGERALRGVELAVSLHNATAGVPPVQVIIKDTASDAGRTLQALQELERENVSAVIGPLVHAEAVSREAQRIGLPIVAMTQKEGVTGVGEFVFRNFLTPPAQMRALAAHAVEKLGVAKAVVLYPDEAYGRTFMGLFRNAVEARGGEVLASVPYSPEATDFAAPIKRLLRFSREVPKEPRADRREPRPAGGRRSGLEEKDTERIFDFQAVFIPDEPKKVAMLVPQLVYHDIKNVLLLGTNLWHSEALIRLAEPYVQGAVLPEAFFPGSAEAAVRRFVSAFEETYQDSPGFIEAIAYDTAMMLFEVLGRPGVRLRSDVAAALHGAGEFRGATGATRFDADGEPEKRLRILEVRGRRFVELE